MKEPVRWRDDPALAEDIRAVLRRLPKARPLDAATQSRIGHQLGRHLTLPLALTSWLTIKAAAASLALAAASMGLGAVLVHEVHVVKSPSVTASAPLPSRVSKRLPARQAQIITTEASIAQPTRLAPSAVAAACPDEDTSESKQNHSRMLATARPRPSAAPSPSPRNALETEAAMLELARRALASSPAEALAIAEEHRSEFPEAALSLERELIRVEAFHRLGRRQEARALAEGLRQHGGLYSERVNRLIEKGDGKDE
jgi:hypothetical protein